VEGCAGELSSPVRQGLEEGSMTRIGFSFVLTESILFPVAALTLDQAVKEQGRMQAAQFRSLGDGGSLVQRTSATNDSPTDGSYSLPYTGFDVNKHGKMTRMPDGSTIFTFDSDVLLFPNSPKSFLDQIKRTAAEKGNNAPEFSELYVKLGDAYKKEARITEAIDAYSAGIQVLKDQLKAPRVPEPEKK
jgi:hypothetical protein